MHAMAAPARTRWDARATGRPASNVVPLRAPDTVKPPVPGAEPTDGFADFYKVQLAPMTRMAYLLVGSRETAQDLVQDSFVRVHAKWASVQEPQAYLRRAVVNACNSHHRRRRLERRFSAERAIDTDDALDADELSDALATLPYRQRAVLVLRYYHDLSEAEIASALGVRPGTVGSLASRALAQLRTEIER